MDFRLSTFNRPKYLVLLILGYGSGLPFGLLHGTLQNWFADSGVDIVTIGCLSLLGLPYLLKVFWSPFLDRFIPPFLGRRRGWILLCQLILFVVIAWVGIYSPSSQAKTIAMLALVISMLSATQDIAIDAYRTDILNPKQRGVGAACAVTGFRVAILISGGVAMVMADHLGWRSTWLFLSASLLFTVLATYYGKEPELARAPRTIKDAVTEPLREFSQRDSAVILLLLIMLYKMSDAFSMTFTGPFLIQMQFSLSQIGVVTKIMGGFATLIGLFLGGAVMARIGLYRALIIFGVLQAVSNLFFMLLALVGKQFTLMVIAVFLEHFCEGMATAAFMAFLMGLCDHRFTAVQFALFSSLAAVGRELVGPVAGVFIKYYGWANFYLLTVMVGIPGLLLLMMVKHRIGSFTTTTSQVGLYNG